MQSGTIIILNGASSAGKTSLLKALQNTFDEPFLEAGIDKFIWMLPERYLDRPLWDDVLGQATQAGAMGHQLVLGMHRAIESLSRAGLNVVADAVLVEPAWWLDCAQRLADRPAFLVGLHCPLEVLEAREKARRDRTLGQARAQFEVVHGPGIYDIEVDTSVYTPEACAALIKAQICSGQAPSALRQIKRRADLNKEPA
jgi:chloramphenicol 3-O phosphotransferase